MNENETKFTSSLREIQPAEDYCRSDSSQTFAYGWIEFVFGLRDNFGSEIAKIRRELP